MSGLTTQLIELAIAVFAPIYDNILTPFRLFIDPNRGFFVLYFATAALTALVIHIWFEKRNGSVSRAFTRAVWWSASSRADYRFFFVHLVTWSAWVGPLLLSTALVADFMARGFGAALPGGFLAGLPEWTIRVAFTLAFFVAFDFGRFFGHWLQHMNPVLWEFHKVHHSAETLTPFTSSRGHPVDFLIQHTMGVVFSGAVTGLFMWAGGGAVGAYTFLGANIFTFALRLTGVLRHSHVRFGFGRLERHLISPAMHQIHHSLLPEHRNANLGLCFTWWDRIAGTWCPSAGVGEFPMGLGDGSDGQWHNVWRMYWWPVRNNLRRLTGRGTAPAVAERPAAEGAD